MGLDSVEILLGWEAALGVTIADAEAEVLVTPRQVIDLLAAKLGATDDRRGACRVYVLPGGFRARRQGHRSGAQGQASKTGVESDRREQALRGRNRRATGCDQRQRHPGDPDAGLGQASELVATWMFRYTIMTNPSIAIRPNTTMPDRPLALLTSSSHTRSASRCTVVIDWNWRDNPNISNGFALEREIERALTAPEAAISRVTAMG